jgi:hypothetical protein
MTAIRRFSFESHRSRSKSAEGSEGAWEILSDSDYKGSLERIKVNAALAAKTPQWAEDLLRVFRAAHLVDRRVPRASAADRWSRDLELRVQVADSARWHDALPVLGAVLTTLTGDNWILSTISGAPPIDAQPRLFDGWTADSVALFSGGLDSAAYAARHLARGDGNLLLVSHDQANAHMPQERLLGHLERIAGAPGRVLRRPMSSEARTRGLRLESSTRSRGLSYIASAVFAAAAHGVQQVIVPENGQLAINPPISPARRGSCSTRSVHPTVLALINELICLIGGDVTLENPFLAYTKGDVCQAGLDAGLGIDALAATVSCGSHTVQRGFGNCGYCFPCLIRRSGMLAGLGCDPSRYSRTLADVLTEPSRSQHLQELRLWVRQTFTVHDLLADIPLPSRASLADAVDVVSRGQQEIRQMLNVLLPR